MNRALLRVGLGAAVVAVVAGAIGLATVAREIRRQSRVDEALWLPLALALALAERKPIDPLVSPWKSHLPCSV